VLTTRLLNVVRQLAASGTGMTQGCRGYGRLVCDYYNMTRGHYIWLRHLLLDGASLVVFCSLVVVVAGLALLCCSGAVFLCLFVFS